MVAAAGALVVAAAAGAFLVFQPDASTSSGAVQGLARALTYVGIPRDYSADVIGFTFNVALFVPGSFAAALLWPRVRWWQWVLVGFLVSAGIEVVQGAFIPARQAQLNDLISNTLGGALGSGAATLLTRARSRGVDRQDGFTV